MPLVYIHGVNSRRGIVPDQQRQFDRAVLFRDQLFRTVSFGGVNEGPRPFLIENPCWGDNASHFAWNLASLPGGPPYEALGAATSGMSEVLSLILTAATAESLAVTKEDDFLLSLGRMESLPRAVDTLAAAVSYVGGMETSTLNANGEWIEYLLAMGEYARQNSHPQWLQSIKNDEDLIIRIVNGIGTSKSSRETLGVTSTIVPYVRQAGRVINEIFTSAKETIKSQTLRGVGQLILPTLQARRQGLTEYFGRASGDIFVYLHQRGSKRNPGAILRTIKAATRNAVRRQRQGDQLIVVAHSLGGIIGYDLLTYYLANTRCDLFITVGSQVGLFEELKLFRTSDPAVPSTNQSKVVVPKNIVRWINVYDIADPISFAAENIFDRVEDYHYDNKTLPGLAHIGYFDRRDFHERLRERIRLGARSAR